ncbi:GNAT family N-acetyltransferase [Kutzneria sp. NPDC052558]|uniref:GNAT family N-acetyltransferase n=1 Tax=Kutzneria sp. NPDC052558 TaxID=3364121 RepID=UPI0037C5B298
MKFTPKKGSDTVDGMDIVAVTEDLIPALVTSVAALFAEDGGRHDPWMDTGWPDRAGAAYYRGRLDGQLCLLAREHGRTVGHLVGRLGSSELRPGATVAVLESMRVDESVRRDGVGSALVGEFTAWASRARATEFRVTAFAANEGAIGFYRSRGFEPFEVTLRKGVTP